MTIQDLIDAFFQLTASPLFKIGLIIVLAEAVIIALAVVSKRVIRHSVKRSHFNTRREELQREKTLISVSSAFVKTVVWLIALAYFLMVLGVNLGPLLAGAGVAGVALGFGAQQLVRDFLAGVFIVLENQYRVGDILRVNKDGVSGQVERITLRMTQLRDLEGKVHYIPNGEIKVATNMTMEFAQFDVELGVAYDSDLDKVEEVINKVGQDLFEDRDWEGVALEAPHMLRVESFDDSAITVKIVCKTAPIRQWEVRGEFLRRLKKAFDKEGIDIPFPQRVIHMRGESK
ncbi:potassium transporter KefA [Candidatus Saccharibacteria bacterium]|nr:MAG: potassium transporter KefA [Candidatus Saccharibacteria bacterium]